MAQEDRSRLVEWLELARDQVPVVRGRLEDWLAAVREEPALIWQTATVRYVTYALGAVVLLWGASHLAGSLAPPPPASAKPIATTADFHVVCRNTACGHHWVIHREFGFRKFPVECPECGQRTGVQARRCNSRTCQGRWVAPVRIDGVLTCPHCGRGFR